VQVRGRGAATRDRASAALNATFPADRGLCYVGSRMNVRLALSAASMLCLLAVVHCGQRPKPPEVATTLPARVDAGSAGGEGGGAGEAAEPEHHRPDPALVQKALDRTGTPTPGDEAAHGLRFEVVEIGPHRRWALAVINRGGETMNVVFDPRLLTLEVEAPPDPKPKKHAKPPKPHLCRLPDGLRPARADAAYVLELAPGHGMVEAFDPRLYCLPENGTTPLVAGARVTASFGWEPKTKPVWRHGKRVEEPLPVTPPFVASIAPNAPDKADAGVEDADAAASDGGETPSGVVMKEEAQPGAGVEPPVIGGVKELRGTPFELGSDYAPPPPPPANGLVFDMTRGSDAANEDSATVTVRLTNHSSRSQTVYFRRELVTFQVSSVDGTSTCDPGPDERSPDRQAFTRLAPGRSLTVTSRLEEMCEKDTFARPGLYLVRATFDSNESGSAFGLDAFVGHLTAWRPATVRIRAGKLPFPGTRSLADVQVGAPPAP
jgi:hypothetical protein